MVCPYSNIVKYSSYRILSSLFWLGSKLFSIIRKSFFWCHGRFIVFKLITAKLPDSEFPLYGIVLFGLYGFKGAALSLIALLSINISFKAFGRVIFYKVLLYVLPGDVFGAAAGFLTGVL